MMLTPTLTLSIAMLFAQPRLAERALADIAVIQVPRSTKEMYEGVRDDQQGRLVFTFSSDYFWSSLGSLLHVLLRGSCAAAPDRLARGEEGDRSCDGHGRRWPNGVVLQDRSRSRRSVRRDARSTAEGCGGSRAQACVGGGDAEA